MACALGDNLTESMAHMDRRESGLKPLAELLRKDSEFGGLMAGWIPNRRLLLGRRYGAASNAAVQVSRRACEGAGWTDAVRRHAWLFVGSSRGNTGELVGAWPERRPISRFRASNLMHSEIAAAVSIELGIRGPWQVFSNGCASGLDALGFAAMALKAGVTPRALVVAVDLPLIPELLAAFRATGVLSTNNVNDPYSADTTGFLPGEAAVAVTLERSSESDGWCAVENYSATSDAFDAVQIPEDGAGIAECLSQAVASCAPESIAAVCPHATGTLNHARSELSALHSIFKASLSPACLLVKPYTGHTLGASGLLDVALLAASLKAGRLMPNLSGLTGANGPFRMPANHTLIPRGGRVVKLSVGMGGHNAAVVLSTSHDSASFASSRK